MAGGPSTLMYRNLLAMETEEILRSHPIGTARTGPAPVDASLASEQAFLGILGMPGLTAYSGLVRVVRLQEGDVVFVSAAAGAVQVAVAAGARPHRSPHSPRHSRKS